MRGGVGRLAAVLSGSSARDWVSIQLNDVRRAEMIRYRSLNWCFEMWLACIALAIEVTRVMVGGVVLLDAGHL